MAEHATNVDKERAKGSKKRAKEQAAASEAGTERRAADPILDGGGSVTLAGRDYPLRRLGVRDAFEVARILGSGLRMLRAGTYDAMTLGAVFVSAVVQNEEQVTKFLADLIGVEHEAFMSDAERFPIDSVPLIIDGLVQHQDMDRFFKTLTAMQDRMMPAPEAKDKASAGE